MTEKGSNLSSILHQAGSTNLVLEDSDVQGENFVKKISSLFKTERLNKICYKNINFFDVKFSGYFPVLFFAIKNLQEIINLFDEEQLEDLDLKKFTVTFLSPQQVDNEILGRFGEKIAIKKKKFKYICPVKYIGHSTLKKSEMEVYLQMKKTSPKIFEIKKMKKKRKFTTRRVRGKAKKHTIEKPTKTKAQQPKTNNNANESDLENSEQVSNPNIHQIYLIQY